MVDGRTGEKWQKRENTKAGSFNGEILCRQNLRRRICDNLTRPEVVVTNILSTVHNRLPPYIDGGARTLRAPQPYRSPACQTRCLQRQHGINYSVRRIIRRNARPCARDSHAQRKIVAKIIPRHQHDQVRSSTINTHTLIH